MNLSPEWVDLLRDSGIDAIHWSKLGETGDADNQRLADAPVVR
jgi:predicted nuclease of predicted toxin-antitoxin system